MKKTIIIKYLFLAGILVIPIIVWRYAISKKSTLDEKWSGRENFTLNDLKLFERDGSEFDKTNLIKDKTTLVVVFSKDCDMCLIEIKEIKDNFERFAESNLLFIGVNNEETYRFLEEEPYNLLKRENVKLLHDNEGILYKKLKVVFTPTVLVFDSKGKMKNIYEGFHSIESLTI